MGKQTYATIEDAVIVIDGQTAEIADLKKQLSAADTKSKSADKQIEQLTGQLGTANDQVNAHASTIGQKDEVIKSLTEKAAGVDGIQSQLVEALQTIGELSEQLDLEQKHGKDGTIVIVKGKKYKLIGNSFLTVDGNKTAEDLSKDPKALQRMVDNKSAALIEIEK